MAKATKQKEFVLTDMMRHDGEHYEAGHLMFGYACQLLRSVGWRVGELDFHPDSPLNQECKGHEHERLLQAGASTARYCPSAQFVVRTKGGKKRYMCRQCVELVAEAVYAKDRDRISALWAQMLTELRDPEEDVDGYKDNGGAGDDHEDKAKAGSLDGDAGSTPATSTTEEDSN